MDRPERDFDNLLRSHLSGELDAMRGQSARAFAREVTRPMERRLQRIGWGRQLARAKHWSPIGLAIAACTTMAVVLPHFIKREAPAEIAETISKQAPLITPQFANYERTTEFRHVDEGSAVMPNGVPARKLRQQQVEALRYVDPLTKEEYEWVIPTERNMVIPAHRQ